MHTQSVWRMPSLIQTNDLNFTKSCKLSLHLIEVQLFTYPVRPPHWLLILLWGGLITLYTREAMWVMSGKWLEGEGRRGRGCFLCCTVLAVLISLIQWNVIRCGKRWWLWLCLVLSQCDAVSVLEKEHDYREEHFDFIQSHIRRFCLQCILSNAKWRNRKLSNSQSYTIL